MARIRMLQPGEPDPTTVMWEPPRVSLIKVLLAGIMLISLGSTLYLGSREWKRSTQTPPPPTPIIERER